MITRYNDFLNENKVFTEKDPEYHEITEYSYDDRGGLVCNQDTILNGDSETTNKIPFKITKVNGNFVLWNLGIENLDNCPDIVTGYFDIWQCKKITNLIGSPKKIGTEFSCADCPKITSMEGCPEII